MSFSISQIVNRFLNVHNKVKAPDGNWVDMVKKTETQHMRARLSQSVSGTDEHIVFASFNKKVIIDYLEYGVSNQAIYPKLTIDPNSSNENYTNQLFHVVNFGSARSLPSVTNLENRKSQLLEVVNYDEALNVGKVMLKQPIVLPQGCQLSFSATSGESGTVTYKVFWREIEE